MNSGFCAALILAMLPVARGNAGTLAQEAEASLARWLPVPVAVEKLARGRQSEAEAVLAAAAIARPNSAPVLFLKAVCTRSRFELEKARPEFSLVISRAPDSTEAVASACMLGIDFSRNWGSALHYYQCLLALRAEHPEDDGILWLSALATRSLTRFSDWPEHLRGPVMNEGIADYRALLERFAPGEGPVLVHQTMANLLEARGDEQEALAHRETAVRLEPRSWSLWGYSVTLDALGRYEQAEKVCGRALAMERNDEEIHYTLGLTRWHAGHAAEAFAAWDDASGKSLGADRLAFYGRCALETGEWTRAWDYLSAAARRAPDDKAIQIYRARAAVHLEFPGACGRVLAMKVFDFNGNPVERGEITDPWFQAATSGDLAAIRAMEGSTDIDRRYGSLKVTALMLAAQEGWVEVEQELVNHHAKLDLSDANGNTALHYACDFDQAGCVRPLVAAGAKLDPVDRWQQTPLINAISSGCDDGVRQLLAAGADASWQTGRGDALHFAVADRDRIAMQLLLARQVDVNATTPATGETVLMALCRDQRRCALLQPLLAAGADVRRTDKQGRTALHDAIVPDANTGLIDGLLAAGADAHAAAADGLTPITEARSLGYEELALKMEAGRAEAFRWPALPPLMADETPAVAAFTLPVRFACEQPYVWLKPGKKPDKGYARRQLSTVFGVTNAQALRAAIDRLNHGKRYDEAPDERAGFDAYFQPLAETAFLAEGRTAPDDDSAWIQAHRIYFAELGVLAGYMSEAEGTVIMQNATDRLSEKLKSWPEFAASFTAGAEHFEGWNRGRAGRLCERLLKTQWTRQAWPKTGGAGDASKVVALAE